MYASFTIYWAMRRCNHEKKYQQKPMMITTQPLLAPIFTNVTENFLVLFYIWVVDLTLYPLFPNCFLFFYTFCTHLFLITILLLLSIWFFFNLIVFNGLIFNFAFFFCMCCSLYISIFVTFFPHCECNYLEFNCPWI